MKKNIGYSVIVSVCCLVSSCGGWLEEQSKDLVYAQTCEDLNELLIGNAYMFSSAKAYEFLLIQGGRSHGNYWPYLSVLSDELDESVLPKVATQSSWNSTDVGKFSTYYYWKKNLTYEVGKVGVDVDWKALYEHISYVNVVLEKLEELTEEKEEDRNQIRGEALFLRGYYYYMLVNLYASPYVKATASTDLGIPLKLVSKVNGDFFKRNTIGEVYSSIVNDLTKAADCLTKVEQRNYYRVNETATRILLSRVYLYQGEYRKAIEQSELALAANKDLENLNEYKGACFFSKENKEIEFTQGRPNAIPLTFCNNSTFIVSDKMLDSYLKYNKPGVKDLRVNKFFYSKRGPSGETIYGRVKGTYEVDVFDVCVFRRSEAYLNKAEAEACLNEATAIATLRPLLESRFENGNYPAEVDGLTGAGLVEFIREERARELIGEGHRWFDLRRYAVSPEYPSQVKLEHKHYGVRGVFGGKYVLNEYDNDKAAWMLPIPIYEIEYNDGEMLPNPERPDREIQN